MDFKRANPGDALLLTEIAFASKRHWRYPEEWIQEWRSLLTVESAFIADHDVWEVLVGGKVAGFYALDQKADRLELPHFWVRPEFMGRGVGRALFLHAASKAHQLGAGTLYIESDPNAEGFYVRLGAKRVGVIAGKVAGKVRDLPLLAYEITRTRTG